MPSPGVIVDRGIRILRLGLWLGGGVNIAAATLVLVRFAPQIVTRTVAFEALRYYSGLLVALGALGIIGIVAAYAPYGNRRLIRILTITHLAIGSMLWMQAPGAGLDVGAFRVVHLVAAVTIYIGLRLARL